MKFLLNFKLMRALGLLFHLVPNADHLNGAWQKGYTLLKALYDFVAHFNGTPTDGELLEVIAAAQAEEAAAEAAPAPVPAPVPPAGPAPDLPAASRPVIEA